MNQMEEVEHLGQQLQMDEMRKKGLFTDGFIHLPAENVSFPIHKAIMASCSHYFRSLFTWGMSNRDYENDVMINGVSAKTMEAVIEYAYVRRVDIHPENVEDLIAAADRFHIFGLQKHCTDFLVNELSSENCIGIRMFFDFYSCRHGFKMTSEFILKNFKEISETSQEFLQLSFDNLKDIISDDKLCISDESEVLQAILRWMTYDNENRKCHFADLLSQVRFAFMDNSFFNSFKTTNTVLEGCTEVTSIIEKAEKLKGSIRETKSVLCDLHHNMSRPRVPREILFVVGGWSSNGVVASIETYDRYSDRWFEAPVQMPQTRAYHATVPLDDAIYVVGGYDGSKYLNTVVCYRPALQTWEFKAQMVTRRCYVAGVQLKGKIYVCGGFDGRQRHDSVEYYCPSANQWSDAQPMRQRRSDCGATVSGGKIYVSGGFDGSHCLSSLEVYNDVTNQWTMLTNMSTPRSGVSILSVNNVIIAVGGYDGSTRLTSVEEYKPCRNAWLPVESMTVGRSNFSAIQFNKKVYVIGGYDGSITTNHVECLDLNTKTWSVKCSLNTGRSALSSCVMVDLSNAKEFTWHGRHSSSL